MTPPLNDDDREKPREFRDEDRMKPIIAPAGITVGTVRTVKGDRATVERTEDQDSLTEEVLELLGWDDDDDEEREIRREHVERYEDDAVHLRKGP